MAAYEVLLLNTAIPQIQAAQTGDTYVVPRDIAFSAALTLSAGTANGVPYLNGSKVLTTGSALTFDGTNLGIGVAPVYKLDIAWNAASTERARIRNSSNNASAITLFQIENDANNSLQILQRSSTASNANESVLQNNSGGALTLTTIADTPIRFLQNNTEQMRLNSSGLEVKQSQLIGYSSFAGVGTNGLAVAGNVGIGTSSPASKLDVTTTGADSVLSITVAGVQRWQHRVMLATGYWQLHDPTGGNTALTVDTSGNLGIGTSSPAARLVSAGSSATNFKALILRNGDGTTGSSASIDFEASSGTQGDEATMAGRIAGVRTGSGTNGALTFSTTNVGVLGERARITSGGDFQTSSGGSVQVGGTAARATTAGTNRVDIFNGTAPVGTLANGVSFYSAAGEANVMDAAGNATLLSPHDSETNEWIFRSKHTPSGKVLRIDVERLLRFVNAHFGLDAVKEFVEE